MAVFLTNLLSRNNCRLICSGLVALATLLPAAAYAGTALSFPVTTSEVVVVTGTPRLALNIGGVTRYATYAAGSGTNTLTFTYNTQQGDLDLDGIAITSPLDLNGGTIKDLGGNAVSPLTFTLPNTANVKVDHPSLSIDAINNDYILNGTHYASLTAFVAAAGGTFSRTSTATYFDASGNLQTAASGVPRFDYDPVTLIAKGLLLEEARTNYVQNSQFSGITTGGPYATGTTLGGHWQVLGAGNFPTGTIAITGTGTANGIPYLDLRFQGTNSSGGNGYLTFNTITADKFAIVTGDKTITSAWLGVTSYSSVSGTCSILLQSRSSDSSGGFAGGAALTLSSLSAWQKRETPVLTHGATGVKADGWIFLVATPGATCDVTVRLGGVQVEKAGYVSSYIPTTAGMATRQADALSIPTGSWYNQSAGSFMANVSWLSSTGTGYPMLWRVDDATSNNRWNLFYNQGASRVGVDSIIGGANQTTLDQAASLSGSVKAAAGQAAGNTNAAFGGVLKTLITTWTPPPVTQLTLSIGSASKWIAKTKYYPARVADAQLQLLTQ